MSKIMKVLRRVLGFCLVALLTGAPFASAVEFTDDQIAALQAFGITDEQIDAFQTTDFSDAAIDELQIIVDSEEVELKLHQNYVDALKAVIAANATGEAGNASSSEAIEDAPTPSPLPEATYDISKVMWWPWTDSLGTQCIVAILEVTNVGEADLYISSGSYDLEKENGTLVASRTIRNVYPKVIGPGEKVICFDAGRLDGVDITEETSLIPRVEVDRARVENIKFPVTDIQLSAGVYGGIKALGRVENTTDELYEDIRVAVFLYDTNDMPIGLLRASLPSRLAPGEKVGFEANEFSSQGSIGIELVARFEAVAYPMQYNW